MKFSFQLPAGGKNMGGNTKSNVDVAAPKFNADLLCKHLRLFIVMFRR